MNKTSIEWTHRPGTTGMTWNPIRARLKNVPALHDSDGKAANRTIGTFCTRISPGCQHCYASAINKRFGTGLEFTVPNLAEHEFYIDEKILEEPLKRKKPATIFVGDMFDLFHEAIPSELITQVLRIPDRAKQHTFQFLTKRAGRMCGMIQDIIACCPPDLKQPPSNMWFGVSVESQKYANERIPLLLQTPAAIRFLSVEPLLEAVDLRCLNLRDLILPGLLQMHMQRQDSVNIDHYPEVFPLDALTGRNPADEKFSKVDWVICGGESGPGARMFRAEWALSLLKQCRQANVAFFMKQFGSYPVFDPRYDKTISGATRKLRDRKGGDMSEWPGHLCVREFPR